MTNDFTGNRTYPRAVYEGGRFSREKVVGSIKETLARIEEKQSDYSSRLTTVENRINHQLEVVAENTTSMSRSLEAIQMTNSKLVDVIGKKDGVPSVVMVVVVLVVAAIFLTRELAITGGSAKLGMDGIDITSGAHRDNKNNSQN